MSWAWIIVALPALALGMTLLNLLFWPRGRAVPRANRRVSILIPARNEATRIEACVRSALTVRGVAEVLVYDDASDDDTAAIVNRIAKEDSRLASIDGSALPSGWVGKAHACHVLASHAVRDALVFIDADTTLTVDAVERILDLHHRYGAGVVTAVPRQLMYGFAERMVMPFLHLTYTSWLFTPLVWATKDPRLLAANGQVLAVERAAYDELGGFESVKDAVVEDMAFCRRAKTLGLRVVFADGRDLASCRMYTSWREVWEGFSKNVYLGVGGNAAAVLGVALLYLTAFVLPFVLWPWLGAPALVAIAINVVLRAALALRFGHPPSSVVLHPIGALAVVAIALNSWRWAVGNGVRWRGRTYEVTK